MRKLSLTIAAGLVSAALLAASQTVALAGKPEAVPAVAPDAASPPALAGGVDSLKNTAVPAVAPETASAPALAAGTDALLCNFYTQGDYVHVSGTDASGHGWWTNVNCDATWAVVTVVLQEYYSDGTWRDKGSGSATVRSGGGSGNRATGRAGCNAGTALTGWRSVIDVDLVGQPDDPSKLTTSSQNIACRRS